MNPQSVLDAAQLIATASASLVVLVQLAKFGGFAQTPRAVVALAVIGGAALTGLYAASNGLFTLANAFALVIAAVTIAAAGAGIHSAATAAAAKPAL
ncbi:MAG: hypothetical protein Q7S25_00855 [Candidatus Limnocylindria bacterium]|nr:hypothetical protein [Candidatus Limnocylindria bacterium]